MLEKISINNSISVFPCANIPDILVLHKGPLCKWCQEFSLRKLTEMLKVTTPVTPMHLTTEKGFLKGANSDGAS